MNISEDDKRSLEAANAFAEGKEIQESFRKRSLACPRCGIDWSEWKPFPPTEGMMK